jgi:hypothetical protein
MSYTTEQCKAFLVNYFFEQHPAIHSEEKEWKRTKKYKNEEGLWLRDFTHPTLGNITLVETAQGLNVINPDMAKTVNLSDDHININWLTFDKKSQGEALKLVKHYVEELDIDEESSRFEKYSYAIPNHIGFYFYEEYMDNSLAEKKRSTKIGNKDFVVTIAPLCDPHFDQHINWLIGNFLPDYLDEASEALYEIQDSEVTLEQFVRDMSQRGFVYLKDECALGVAFSDTSFTTISNQKEKKNQIANEEAYEIRTHIAQGDIAWLEEKIQSGFNCNTIFANNDCALTYALKKKQPTIFTLLLNHTDLSILPGKRTIIANMFDDFYEHKDNADFFFDSYLYPFFSSEQMKWDKQSLVDEDEFLGYAKDSTLLIYLPHFSADRVQKLFDLFDSKMGSENTNLLIYRLVDKDTYKQQYPTVFERFLNICQEKSEQGDYHKIGELIKYRNYGLALEIIHHIQAKPNQLSIDGVGFYDFFNQEIKHWQEEINYEVGRGIMVMYVYPNGQRRTRAQDFQDYINHAQRFIKQVQNGDNGYDPTKHRTKF